MLIIREGAWEILVEGDPKSVEGGGNPLTKSVVPVFFFVLVYPADFWDFFEQ